MGTWKEDSLKHKYATIPEEPPRYKKKKKKKIVIRMKNGKNFENSRLVK